MHKKTLALAALALSAAPAWADHPPVAQQGGRLAEAHGHRMELVTRGTVLEVLLKDEHNQPMPATGYSGKAVVMAPGGKADITLSPDGTMLTGALPAGADLAATVLALKAADGHSMNARFPALQAATPPAADLVAKGKPLYAAKCAACHGEALQGQAGWQAPPGAVKLAPALDATGHGWLHPDTQLAEAIRKGSDPMPAFATEMKEEEIAAVIAYFKASWPAATLAQQPKAAGPAATAVSAAGGGAHHGH